MPHRMPRQCTLSLLVFCCFLAIVQTGFGQGLLVNETEVAVRLPRIIMPPRPPHPPRPPRPVPPESSYTIKSLEVSAEVKDQIAQVNVSQAFMNTGSRQMEVSFVFPLPYDGAVDSMVLLVDGKEYPAKLLDAKEARKTYMDIVRRNEDPALLEWIGHGMFKTSVFPVPAGASRTVQLQYTQLLRVDGGLTDFLFPMSTAKYTAKPIEKLEIHLNVDSAEEIKNVYSPTHGVTVKRPVPNRATVSFEAKNTVPNSDFRLLFDSGKGEVSTRLLSYRPDEKDDGYFMLLASPKVEQTEKKTVPKSVIFALDHSGSMSGVKMDQARDALKFVLNNLRDGDTFNIVPYSSNVSKFKPEIMPFNAETRAEAIAYADSIRASGMTNIDEALKASLSMIQDKKTPSYVIFLTDGQPTSGERNEMKLAGIAKSANAYGARLFSFGVGYDVNARLLDRLSRDGRGQSEYVKPDENIEEHVARLYNRISSPVLTDVAFTFSAKGQTTASYGTNRVYPSDNFDLFAGEQLVIVGRYSKPGEVDILVKGKIGEESKEYRFDGRFIEKSGEASLAFIPRLWAMRRIGEILDQMDLSGQNDELVKELVELSTKYGILTPYTSFLADENTSLTDFSGNVSRGRAFASNLSDTSGQSGVAQRSAKGKFQRSMQVNDADLAQANRVAESAMRPPVAAAPARASGGGFGGRALARDGGGRDGGAQHRFGAGGAAAPQANPLHLHKEKPQALDFAFSGGNSEAKVQNVANRSFFRKNDVWVDATLTEMQQKPENVVTVKQFSEAYFKLIEDRGEAVTPFLILDGAILLEVAGQAYRIEP